MRLRWANDSSFPGTSQDSSRFPRILAGGFEKSASLGNVTLPSPAVETMNRLRTSWDGHWVQASARPPVVPSMKARSVRQTKSPYLSSHCADSWSTIMHPVPPMEVRKFIFDSFLETGRAPLVEEIMPRFNVGREEAVKLLLELQASHHILLLPGTHRILMANPFSNLPTPFRVSSGGMSFYANCAWDAIALHVLLERDVRIASFCHHCAATILLNLSDGKRVAGERNDLLVYLGTPVSKWYDNLLVTCSNTMVFFSSQEHLDDWKRSNSGAEGVALSIDTMIRVVTPISKGRGRLDYQMPSRSQLMAHWKSIGLSGQFWTF
jgi:Alkylmercury lyase